MPSRSTLSPRRSRRLSLAPTHAHNVSSSHDEYDLDSASLLMDLSLTDLQKTSSPFKKRAIDLSDDALDALSEGELERLAWEAIEEENRLKVQRRKSPRLSSDDNTTMKNVTIRRKSNSPKKIIEEMPITEMLLPLPKTVSSSTVKHCYDRQASPSKSAMKRTTARKSVIFGSIDEYEISVDTTDSSNLATLARASLPTATGQSQIRSKVDVDSSSSIAKAQSSVCGSSSPLSRFNRGQISATKGVLKSVVTKMTSPKHSPRVKAASTAKKVTPQTISTNGKKVSSKPSPKAALVGSRMREAIKETSVKSRLKARQSAMHVKANIVKKELTKAPTGFRITSTGTLVAETKCDPFKAATAKAAPRKGRPSSSAIGMNAAQAETRKANAVPEWMKRRKEALAKADEDRFRNELKRVRAQELLGNKVEKPETTRRRQLNKQSTSNSAPISAVEKRIAERAVWEAKRKEKEDLINAEREKAKMERQAREEEEYKLARQRTIPRANPVPEFIRSRRAK